MFSNYSRLELLLFLFDTGLVVSAINIAGLVSCLLGELLCFINRRLKSSVYYFFLCIVIVIPKSYLLFFVVLKGDEVFYPYAAI